jgi:peptidoglycan/LPS O-acetylase OafA/YrhL
MIEENELTKKYFPFLDGLRGIAILWVILHHLPIELPSWAEQIRIRGDLGVELFFSISSFLVFRSLHQCMLKNNHDKFEFLKRRIFRIFPPYFLTLFMILGLSYIDTGLGQKLISIKDILMSFPLFYYNYAKPFTTGTVPGSLNVFWSLCFEEQFYITLFLTSLFFPRKIKIFIIIGIIFSISLRLFYYLDQHVLANTDLQMQTHLRLDAILLGCFFYYYWDKFKIFFNFTSFNIFLVLLAIFLHTFIDSRFQGILYILVSFSFTSLIFNLLNQNLNWPATLLQNKFLTKIGVVSFEIYLLHEMFIGLIVKLGLKRYPFLFLIVAYILSIFAALAMHKIFSNPINLLLRKKYITNKKILL